MNGAVTIASGTVGTMINVRNGIVRLMRGLVTIALNREKRRFLT